MRVYTSTFSRYGTYILTAASVIPLVFLVMSHRQRSRPRNNDAVNSQTIVMDQAVKRLVRSTRDATTVLFDGDPPAIATPQSYIEALERTRDVFQSNWEGYIHLFQKCLGYVEEYKCTYDVTETHGAFETRALWKDLQVMADDLSRLVEDLMMKHEEAKGNLESHQQGVTLDKHGALVQAVNETVNSLKDLGVFFKDQVDHLSAIPKTRQELEAWEHSEDVLRQAIGSISAAEDAAQVHLATPQRPGEV